MSGRDPSIFDYGIARAFDHVDRYAAAMEAVWEAIGRMEDETGQVYMVAVPALAFGGHFPCHDLPMGVR